MLRKVTEMNQYAEYCGAAGVLWQCQAFLLPTGLTLDASQAIGKEHFQVWCSRLQEGNAIQ